MIPSVHWIQLQESGLFFCSEVVMIRMRATEQLNDVSDIDSSKRTYLISSDIRDDQTSLSFFNNYMRTDCCLA